MPTGAAESMPFTRAAEQINVTQQLEYTECLHAASCWCLRLCCEQLFGTVHAVSFVLQTRCASNGHLNIDHLMKY